MLRKLCWAQPARFDLKRLRAWVERYSSADEAGKTGRRLREAIEYLQENPRLGKRIAVPDGGDEELREFVLNPYVIRYTVEPDRVAIIRMRRPEHFHW